jgi:transcriptional regulator
MPPDATTKDRLHGTLDALVLKTLSWGPRHGYAIARWLEDTSGNALQIEEGSLYPALYRMERKGWIEADWGTSELGRKARFYKLTARGRRQLRTEASEWTEFARVVSAVLAAPAGG